MARAGFSPLALIWRLITVSPFPPAQQPKQFIGCLIWVLTSEPQQMDNFTISDQYGEYSTLRGEDGKPVVLGRGGFGITVCAFKLRRLGGVEIRDDFALKILRYSATEDPKRRSRILKEILALRDLQHPNLASYKDCGEDEGCVFLVMELCRGGDLAALAARVGALPERFALQVVLQVCAGLDEAHRKGYFHRDLKPTNILISEEVPADAGLPWLEERLAAGHLRFKVVDFGLAGRFESEVKGGGFMGSPMFASPEQVREQKLDSRSDIYSLGMTLWYLATGKGPLLNANGLPVADAREAMRCHTSPSQHDIAFPEHFSEGFRSLLGRMIRKAPDERFRSAKELTDAIRRQIEAMPAPPAQPAGMPLPKAPLAAVATWGTGTFAEYYHVLKQVGRRSIGTFYQARQKASGNTVGFTAWVAANSPNAASEKLIGQHLDRLKSATSDPVAPKVLTKIVDWLRTTDEWCVAEEWSEGEKLDSFVSLRGRSIPLEEAARLLWPLAEACDYLNKQGFDSALLSIDEIRLLSPRAEPDWIGQPIDEWGDWTIRLSALSIPQELAGESRGPGAVESSTTSRFDGCDAGQLRLNKSFCRLLYRLIEGTDAAVAADWDAQAFTAAGKLGAESNALLRDYICGVFADDPMLDILQRVCSHEGIARLPGRTDSIAAPSAPPTRATPAGTVAPSGSLPAPPDSSTSRGAPTSTVMPPGNQSSTVRSSISGSRLPRKSEPIFDVAPANQIEVAQLVPSRPGFVRSPYGVRREQQVPGSEWRENAQVKCQATGRPFQLPAELPTLEAILIGERFDAVLTPYLDPPREIAVPLGKWKAGAEFTCSLTERLLRQPQPLPAPIATAIDDRPGIVRSPFADQPEIEVEVESWKPGQLLACPASGQMFALPAVLPPLLAMPGEAPGSYTSPYAPGRPFDLPAPKCVPGHRFPCPWTAQPLVLPSSLPGHWQFEGSVRQADVPEARSPYFELEGEGWQPLDAADWRPGATIQCRGTGRPFTLPATLPVLRVKAGPNPFSIHSPFPPHETVRVPAQDWIAGAEVSVSLNAETPCRIALPGELPIMDRVEIAELDSVPQGRQAQARGPIGVIRSPFTDDGEWIEVPGQKWLPGVRVICPATSRPFWLPGELPPLEARLGQDLATVNSPYTDDLVKIPALDWIAGHLVPCPQTGMPFLLPQSLPWLEGGVADSRPGWVESPFDRGSAYLVEYAEWKPGGILECPTTERKFALPQSVPEWVPEAELDETNPGLARNPNGPGNWFKVPGTNWEAGATIHCPETQTKLALPAELPALEATLVEGRPGYVETPYTAEPEQVRIHSSKWRGGSLVECPATKRPLRLPGSLPPLVSSFPLPRKYLLPAAAVALLAAIGFLVAMLNRGGGANPPSWAVTEFSWLIPPPIASTLATVPSTPPVTPIPKVPEPVTTQLPDTIVLAEGFEPNAASVSLRLPDGKTIPLRVVAPNGTLERQRTIYLRETADKLANLPAVESLRLSFEAPGYVANAIPIPRGTINRIKLIRQMGTVSWPARDPFYASFYQKIRFVPQQESKREGDKEEHTALFGKGSVELPAGKYTVTFIAKTNLTKDWRDGKIAVKVEDRSLYPPASAGAAARTLNIEEGKDTGISALPQSVHRHMTGSGTYIWGMDSFITGKKTASEVGKKPLADYDLRYWSPCVLKFNDDFTEGEFIDENNLLSCGVDRFLDALVVMAVAQEAELNKIQDWAKTKSYPEAASILKRLAAVLQPPKKLSGVTENMIKESRIEIFDLEDKAWKLAVGIMGEKNMRATVEDAELKSKEEGNLPEFHDWFVQLKKSMLKTSWNSTSAIIMSERPTPAVLKDLDLLAQPLTVGGKKDVPGYFVKQKFVVKKVDENGQVRLIFEPLATKVPYVGERNRDTCLQADLVQKQGNSKISYLIEGVFDGDPDDEISRTINLTPIEN